MKDTMKEMNNKKELDALIDACLEGQLSEAEAKQLSLWIEESSEARQRYWDLAFVHGTIEQSMQSASLKATTGKLTMAPAKTHPMFRRFRLTSLAAGLLIGIFGASMVWAYAIPRSKPRQRQSRDVVVESFEDPELTMAGRFPTSPNHWQGRVSSAPELQELSAVRGSRVGKFVGGGTQKFTYTRYIIDLDEHPKVNADRVRSVEVEASFATSNPKESSAFQIRLGLFSQEPEAVRPIWNDHELLFDTVLGHVGRNYTTVPGDQAGWHKLRAMIEVPPGTRSIVISLGAGNDKPGSATSDHFVDAVRVRLVDTIGQG